MIADTFIRRPILASVCSLVIILAGAMAIPTLPIAQFPELAPPSVQVAAFYNGANAETVETAVTNPLAPPTIPPMKPSTLSGSNHDEISSTCCCPNPMLVSQAPRSDAQDRMSVGEEK